MPLRLDNLADFEATWFSNGVMDMTSLFIHPEAPLDAFKTGQPGRLEKM